MPANERADMALETVFDILTSDRRRYLLYYLSLGEYDADGVRVGDLLEYVRTVEAELSDDPVPVDHRRHLATDLHHTHLPKLAAANVLAYDTRSDIVRYQPSDPLADHLEMAMEHELPASLHPRT